MLIPNRVLRPRTTPEHKAVSEAPGQTRVQVQPSWAQSQSDSAARAISGVPRGLSCGSLTPPPRARASPDRGGPGHVRRTTIEPQVWGGERRVRESRGNRRKQEQKRVCTGPTSEAVTPAGSGISVDMRSSGLRLTCHTGLTYLAFATGCFSHKFTKFSSPAYHTELRGVDDRLTSGKTLGHIPLQTRPSFAASQCCVARISQQRSRSLSWDKPSGVLHWVIQRAKVSTEAQAF